MFELCPWAKAKKYFSIPYLELKVIKPYLKLIVILGIIYFKYCYQKEQIACLITMFVVNKQFLAPLVTPNRFEYQLLYE